MLRQLLRHLPSAANRWVLLLIAGMVGLGVSSEHVFSSSIPERKFVRLDYAPGKQTPGAARGGTFRLSFNGPVEGKLRREAELPLCYLDILGAAVDVSPVLQPFTSGPVQLVRLTQISHKPPVVRATFFLRSLYAPKVQSTGNGLEIAFEPCAPSQARSAIPAEPVRPVPFSLIHPGAQVPVARPISAVGQAVPSMRQAAPGTLPSTAMAAGSEGVSAAGGGTPDEGIKPAEKSSHVSLNVQNGDIRSLLLELARQAGMEMNFRDQVDGTIDLTATVATPLEAIKLVVSELGGTHTVENGEIWVSTQKNPLLAFSDADFVQGADLRGLALGDVLRALGHLGQLNIVLDPSMGSVKDKNVDLVLTKMSYRQAFETLVKMFHLSLKTIDEKTLMVMTQKEALRSIERIVRVHKLSADFKKVQDLLKTSLPESVMERAVIKEDQGNLVVVADKETVDQVVRMVQAIEGKLQKAGEGMVRQFFQPANTKPDEMVKLIEDALGEGSRPKISLDKRTDTLLLTGPKEIVDRAMQLIQRFDLHPTPQVLLRIRLVEMKHDGLKTLGVKLNNSSIAVDDIARIPSHIPVPATLHYLETQGQGKTLANPTIRCMDKEEASIDLTEQIPVKSTVTNYLPVASSSLAAQTSESWTTSDVGIKLEVKPLIHKDNEVSLDLKAGFTELVRMVEGHPWIAKRDIKTKIRVKNEESVVIGGLIRRRKAEGREPLPVVSRFRPLKWLTRLVSYRNIETEETEMVVIITPKIFGVPKPDAKPDASAEAAKEAGAAETPSAVRSGSATGTAKLVSAPQSGTGAKGSPSTKTAP